MKVGFFENVIYIRIRIRQLLKNGDWFGHIAFHEINLILLIVLAKADSGFLTYAYEKLYVFL